MRRAVLLPAAIALLAACGTPTAPSALDLPAATTAPAPEAPSLRAPAAACAPSPEGTVRPCYDTGPGPPVLPLAVVNNRGDLVRLPTSVVHAEPPMAWVVVRVEHPDGCQQLRGAALTETADQVTVHAVGTPPPDGPCVLRLAVSTYRVELSAPLGGRSLRTAP